MTRSILFVEDDETDRFFLKLSLSESNLDIDASYCSSGAEALDRLRTHDAPGLIITDLSMPDMDGLELTETLKSD